MAKNKKPRKKYHPKPRRMPCFDEEQRASVRAMVDRFELVAEIALPRGTADFEDMSCMRSLLLHALIGAVSRGWIKDEDKMDGITTIEKARDALFSVVARAFKRAGTEKPHFVCTADELNALRDGVDVAGSFIRDSVDTTPMRCLQEFYASKYLLRRAQGRPVTKEIIDRMISEMRTKPVDSWWEETSVREAHSKE